MIVLVELLCGVPHFFFRRCCSAAAAAARLPTPTVCDPECDDDGDENDDCVGGVCVCKNQIANEKVFEPNKGSNVF